jgi:hypothetical protein
MTERRNGIFSGGTEPRLVNLAKVKQPTEERRNSKRKDGWCQRGRHPNVFDWKEVYVAVY